VVHKVKGAFNRNLATLILPAGNRAEVVASPFIPAEVEGRLVRYASDLDEAVKLVFGSDVFFVGRPPSAGGAAAGVASAGERRVY
jgi:hypothetical protein